MEDWRVEESGGLTVVRAALLDAVPAIGHAFSTRSGPGEGEFDLGTAGGDHPLWRRRRAMLGAAAGLAPAIPAAVHQVHGVRVVRLSDAVDDPPTRADAIVAGRDEAPGRLAAVRTADCVPLLLADRDGQAVAAVHAGWRGTAGGIATRAVEALGRLGARPQGLVAALGPAIGPCCYRVGRDVSREVARASGAEESAVARIEGDGKARLDLRRANRIQLEAAGLGPDSIASSAWCTCCDERLFFSYRRQGEAAGRLMGCIGWIPSRAGLLDA